MASTKISGRCLCGAVTFTAETRKLEATACHCTMCQRTAAGPYVAIECVPGTLHIGGGDGVSSYQSSPWARRCFCKTCGTPLFWRSLDGRFEVVSAGVLDDKSGLTLTMEIYVDEKPAYYAFANETEKLTGAEFVAMVMGNEGSSE